MPTPFTHLAYAQRALDDDALPEALRAVLRRERGAYMLGTTAADAHEGGPATRGDTHFYAYDRPVTDAPWRVMLRQYPGMCPPHDGQQAAFLAGYVLHLAMDAFWTMNLVLPHIALRAWGGSRQQRFYAMNLLLIHMDERDLARLQPWIGEALGATGAEKRLPFVADDTLRGWQALLHEQLKPGGVSKTLDIVGGRLNVPPGTLRAVLDAPEQMHALLWEHVTPALLADIEARMYTHACGDMLAFWDTL